MFQGFRSHTVLILHLQNSCLKKANLWRNPFTNCLIPTSYQRNKQSVPALMGCYLEETLRQDCKLSFKNSGKQKCQRGLILPSWPLNPKLLINTYVFGTYVEQAAYLCHVGQLAKTKTTNCFVLWLGNRSSYVALAFSGLWWRSIRLEWAIFCLLFTALYWILVSSLRMLLKR